MLLQAAQLALPGNTPPVLDILDTTGAPAGAAGAVRAALAHGDGLILGPLTSAETASVAPLARSAGVPVLAFTNDSSQARPGVWPMGISPEQQIRRLVSAAAGQGRTRFAALLPDTDFGRVMSQALQTATQQAGLPAPAVYMHTTGMAAITAAVRELADYSNRRGPIDARIRALKANPTPEARREILELQRRPIPPPPFDVLLLADTGEALQEIAAMLPYYDIDRSSVQVIGPALWADRSSGAAALPGAWYAAPDIAMRERFARDYMARYGAPAPAIADIAYDAALIARYAAAAGDSAGAALTRENGFVGADGLVALRPDGHVRRALAVLRVNKGGPSVAEPAPDTAAAAGF